MANMISEMYVFTITNEKGKVVAKSGWNGEASLAEINHWFEEETAEQGGNIELWSLNFKERIIC
jgi:hypothetical protein